MASEQSVAGQVRPQRKYALVGWSTPAILPVPILIFAAGFLFGRATLIGILGPAPIALVAALKSTGLSGAVLAVSGAVLGLLSRMGGATYGRVEALIAGAGILIVLMLPARIGSPATVAAGAAMLVALLHGRAHWLNWLGAALVSVLAGSLAFTLNRGFKANRVTYARDGRGGSLTRLVLVIGALAGLNRLALTHAGVMWLPLDSLVASAVIMATAWKGGGAAAAVVGILVGAAGLLVNGPAGINIQAQAFDMMALSTAGLLAGTLRDSGRLGVASAYVCTHLVLRALHLDAWPDALWAHSVAVSLAAVVLFVIPPRWFAITLQWIPGMEAEPVSPSPDPPTAIAEVVSKAMALAGVLHDMQRSATRSDRATSPEAAAAVDLPQAIGQVVERVCEGCQCQLYCWERKQPDTYEAFSDIWHTLHRFGSASINDISEGKLKCIHPHQLIQTFNDKFDRLIQEARHQRQLIEVRLAMREYVQTLARLVHLLSVELKERPERTVSQPQTARLAIRTGVSRLTKRGSLISGDSFLVAPLGTDRFLIALSDGMGTGREAAGESRRAIQALHDLLVAGYKVETAVQVTNLVLTLNPVADRFATLDVAVIDLTTGHAEFTKFGAVPTLIKRGSQVQIIHVEAPPAGLLQSLTVEPEVRTLRPGDWLVIASDGLWDRGYARSDEGRWLLEYLVASEPTGPNALAEALMARALEGSYREPADDMTILTVAVESAEGQVVEPVRREPVPVRRVSRDSRILRPDGEER